ncbi:MAG TPA: polysaccharide deacetylase family protein [Rhodocyclaceae bacterium]|nr:polysaccharide deacetylase family protein [Rhodocyclaceae bacterium]
MRPDPTRYVCVALHDVAPATWQACRRLLEALDEVAKVPTTLLVVPEYHGSGAIQSDKAFKEEISARLECGDELALHGYSHLDDQGVHSIRDFFVRRIYTAGEGEFSALPTDAARIRLRRGIDSFAANDWPLSGFIAPAWLMSDGTWKALEDFSFSYVTTLRHFVLWPERIRFRVPTLTWSTRTSFRRGTSHLWNRQLLRRQNNCRAIRLGLHAADAQHPDVIKKWQRILAACLDDRVPITKSALADIFRHEFRHENCPVNRTLAFAAGLGCNTVGNIGGNIDLP